MPEHHTLMRDFGRLKPQYHGCNLQRYMAKHSIKSDTTAFQLVCHPDSQERLSVVLFSEHLCVHVCIIIIIFAAQPVSSDGPKQENYFRTGYG